MKEENEPTSPQKQHRGPVQYGRVGYAQIMLHKFKHDKDMSMYWENVHSVMIKRNQF